MTLYTPINTATGFRALPKDSMTMASLFVIAQERPWEWHIEWTAQWLEPDETPPLIDKFSCQATWRTMPSLTRVSEPISLSKATLEECHEAQHPQ